MKKILILILFVFTSSIYSQKHEYIKDFISYLPMSYEMKKEELENGDIFRQYIFTAENVDITLDDVFFDDQYNEDNEIEHNEDNGFDLTLTREVKFSTYSVLLSKAYTKYDLEDYAINLRKLLEEKDKEFNKDFIKREYKITTIDGMDVLIFKTRYYHPNEEAIWITSHIYSIDNKLIDLTFIMYFDDLKDTILHINEDFAEKNIEYFISIKRRPLK